MSNSKIDFVKNPLSQQECLELVKAATLAPSADNNQPWHFVVQGQHVVALLDRRHALPSDVDSMFDLIALGAALENMRIAATRFGYNMHIEPPSKGVAAGVATEFNIAVSLRFSRGAEKDPLLNALAERRTSRKLYSKRSPDPSLLMEMSHAARQVFPVELEWITSRRDIRTCAKLIAACDLVRFQAKEFHSELVRQLRYSAEHAEHTRDGLDVRTLELPPGGTTMLKCLRSWKRMQWVHRLGLGSLLALPTWRAVRRSGAIGILSVEQPDTTTYLHGGRALERLWLTANDQGLSLQPLGSLPIYAAQLDHPGGNSLQARHRQAIGRQLDLLGQMTTQSNSRRLLMILRIGYAARPRHRSLRRPVDTFLSHKNETAHAPQHTQAKPVIPQIETQPFATGQDTFK